MRKKLEKVVDIPEGVEARIEGNLFTCKGPEGENKRQLKVRKIKIKIEGGKILLSNPKATKNDKKIMNTLASHLNNMVNGVVKKFEYQLKICHGHFPFTVKEDSGKYVIKNFLGEKANRTVLIPEGAEVEIKKDIITIRSVNKEIAGQASANFEAATKIKKRDNRIFQDGIYIINKNGKLM